jgi:hypothetical protein
LTAAARENGLAPMSKEGGNKVAPGGNKLRPAIDSWLARIMKNSGNMLNVEPGSRMKFVPPVV